MKPMAILVLALLCASCGKSGKPAVAMNDDEPTCDPAHPGVELGPLDAGGSADSSDAVKTGAFALGAQAGCRRLALKFLGQGGASAIHTGPLVGTFERSYGLVRFPLPPGITEVLQADTTFTDSTIAAAYVVHGNGGYHLDVLLAQPATASAHAFDAPARLAIDLAPGGGAIPEPAPRARNVVVLEPRGGGVRYPLVIRGYARTFEANVQAWITQDDKPSAKVFTTAADWMTTWGEFELTIPDGPSGDVQLFVGEESAQDGRPIGVTIPLTVDAGSGAGEKRR